MPAEAGKSSGKTRRNGKIFLRGRISPKFSVRMKLLVFAHTPPPHHGQSYMVKLMLEGFGGDVRQRPPGAPANLYGIECYHVNARFSRGLADVGTFRSAKFFLVFWFCLQAFWCRFRHGVKNLYYVPAPGKPVALYRDWLVMLLCRPFFQHVILHWHAAGLAKWLETETTIAARTATYRLFRPVDLSIVLSAYNVADAAKLRSARVAQVCNCAPDLCPDFARTVAPRRRARQAVRAGLLAGRAVPVGGGGLAGDRPDLVRALFLAHCSREKGLFDAMEGVVLANQELARRGVALKFKLAVAGGFVDAAEKTEFEARLQTEAYAAAVEYLGFISGPDKLKILRETDVLCFPSYYLGENQPVSVIEAMSFGLPVVITNWRSLPEMFPPGYPGLVPPRSPQAIAGALLQLITSDSGERLREHYLAHFTVESYLAGLARAIHSLETDPLPAGVPEPA